MLGLKAAAKESLLSYLAPMLTWLLENTKREVGDIVVVRKKKKLKKLTKKTTSHIKERHKSTPYKETYDTYGEVNERG